MTTFTHMTSWALVLVLLLPRSLEAQDLSPPDVPPGEDVTEGLEVGERAPFRGVLLDVDTSIRHIHRIEWLEFRLRLEHDTSSAARVALTESYDRELTLVRASYDREIEGLRTDLREQAATFARALEPEPFWETGTFGFAMGVLVSMIIAGVVGGLALGL